MRIRQFCTIAALAALVVMAASTVWASDGQGMAAETNPLVHSWEQAQFGGLAVLPACASFAVDRGDPMTGPSMLLIKLDAGCVVPWHWHTAREQLMMVSGTGKIDIADYPSRTVHEGGYIELPAKHHHQFMCKTDCVFFDAISGKFDIHYIDASGAEIPVNQALSAVSETAAATQ